MGKVEYNGKVYDARHGGPFDRGAADSYYGRAPNPHYFVGATYSTDKVTRDQMTQEEIKAYHAGFDENEEAGNFKDY